MGLVLQCGFRIRHLQTRAPDAGDSAERLALSIPHSLPSSIFLL